MNMTKLLIRLGLFLSAYDVQEILSKMKLRAKHWITKPRRFTETVYAPADQAHQDINVGSIKEADIITATKRAERRAYKSFSMGRTELWWTDIFSQSCKSVRRG